MFAHSRSARFAALALAVATPLVASYAAPAFAGGDDADVDVSFDTPGFVGVSSLKGLSRVTIVLCNGTTVVADSWNGAQSGDVAVDGDVRAVFIHSGNNTTEAAEELLELLAGPDAVKGNSTGEIAFEGPCGGGDNSGGDNSGGDNSGGDNSGGDNSGGDNNNGDNNNGDNNNGDNNNGVDPKNIEDPAPATNTPAPSISTPVDPGTAILGVNIERASHPANTDVLGQTVPQAAAELPRTGAGHMQFLVALGLSLLAAGATLRAAFGRRIRSASSPL